MIVVSFSPSLFLFRCVLHPLPLPLFSCLGCIPPLIGLPSLRFMRLPLVCFYCLLDFYFCLSRRYPLLATFSSVLFCLLSLVISDFRFDLIWFRLSCDHGWIRSGSVNVRLKTTTTTTTTRHIQVLRTTSTGRGQIFLIKMPCRPEASRHAQTDDFC